MSKPLSVEGLNKEAILTYLSSEAMRKLTRLDIFERIDSTNTYLLQQAKNHPSAGWVCLAEEQTNGRGRNGKVWLSPKKSNIYCSLLWQFPKTTQDLSSLSLAVGVMVVKALERAGIGQGLQLKWPNDVYYADRKLAGILIEGIFQPKTYAVVIGVGINVEPVSLQSAIGLKEITKDVISRNQLAAYLIEELCQSLPQFEAQGFSAFKDQWQQLDMLSGNLITITQREASLTGTALFVNQHGELVVDVEGKERVFQCGEVSVRVA